MAYIGKQPTPVPLSASDLDDDIISLAKMAGGTDGNLISYDTSGNPVAVATGSDGQVLTSAGAGNPCLFEAAGGGNTLQVKGVSSGTEAIIQSIATWTGTSATEYTPLTMTFTPTLSGSILMVDYHIKAAHSTSYQGVHFITYNHSGISETSVENDDADGSTHGFDYASASTTGMGTGIAGRIFLSLATTNEITFKNRFATASSGGSGTAIGQTVVINRTYAGNNSGDSFAGICTFTVTELASGITTISDTNINN